MRALFEAKDVDRDVGQFFLKIFAQLSHHFLRAERTTMASNPETVTQPVKPSYNPTSDELNNAISVVLKQEVSSKSSSV